MKDYTQLERYCLENEIPCRRGEPLWEHCTFKVGGPADLIVQPGSEKEIEGILEITGTDNLPVLILGKGSNVLFDDAGYCGVIIQLGPRFSQMRLLDENTIYCESGASLSSLCIFARNNGLTGLEFAFGIPGSVGGAIYMNAGAYGGEIKDVLISAQHLCPKNGTGEFCGEGLQFSYRHSVYTGSDKVITGGAFRLAKGNRQEIQARMDDYMNRRREKQPLEYPSAGSTFKRPQGAYASELLDRCGLKGRTVGGAMVSEKHVGFVINVGGATSEDICTLVEQVRREVLGKTGFELECEIKVIKSE